MHRLMYPNNGGEHETGVKARKQQEDSLKGKAMGDTLADIKMKEQEVDYAIRLTEEKLGILKNAVEKKRSQENAQGSTLQEDPS